MSKSKALRLQSVLGGRTCEGRGASSESVLGELLIFLCFKNSLSVSAVPPRAAREGRFDRRSIDQDQIADFAAADAKRTADAAGLADSRTPYREAGSHRGAHQSPNAEIAAKATRSPRYRHENATRAGRREQALG